VAAAAELVSEIGPSRVTLAGVGKRAGYSRGLATHHFGSKGALMQRLVDAVTAQFREAVVEESRSDSPMDELFGLVRTYFRVMANLAPPNRARLVLWADAVATDSPDVRPAMVAADREFREELAKRVERGVATGHFPASVDPRGFAAVVVAMLRGAALQKLLDDQVDLDACRIEVEQLLVDRMTRRPAERQQGMP
jgi:AcrR family transcriptional regulator